MRLPFAFRNAVFVALGALVASFQTVGCGDDGSSTPIDAAGAADAPVADAPVADGPVIDASLIDGPVIDASLIDASPIDASPIDAGPVDAGIDASTTFVCDPVAQTGCGAGEKCDLAASGTFACVPDGPLGEFRRCEPNLQPNACAAGFTCRDTVYGDYRCAKVCGTSAPATSCRLGESCSSVRVTSDGHQYRMCNTPNECNPLLQDCFNLAKGCYHSILGAFCETPPASPVADGAVCAAPTQCKRGSTCLEIGTNNSRCFKVCDPAGGAPTCSASVTCTAFADVGPDSVGACGL